MEKDQGVSPQYHFNNCKHIQIGGPNEMSIAYDQLVDTVEDLKDKLDEQTMEIKCLKDRATARDDEIEKLQQQVLKLNMLHDGDPCTPTTGTFNTGSETDDVHAYTNIIENNLSSIKKSLTMTSPGNNVTIEEGNFIETEDEYDNVRVVPNKLPIPEEKTNNVQH